MAIVSMLRSRLFLLYDTSMSVRYVVVLLHTIDSIVYLQRCLPLNDPAIQGLGT